MTDRMLDAMIVKNLGKEPRLSRASREHIVSVVRSTLRDVDTADNMADILRAKRGSYRREFISEAYRILSQQPKGTATALIAGNIRCPRCPGFVLKYIDEGRLLLCDGCGKVYAAPSVELVEVGDQIPECMISAGKDVYYLEPGKSLVTAQKS